MKKEEGIISLSAQLLLAVRQGNAYQEWLNELKYLDKERLRLELNTDELRKCFWINTYNAFIQILIKHEPKLHQTGGVFYVKKLIEIAGESLSFDDIEHGILRKRKFKFGLGYVPSFFDTAFVKTHQVEKLDFRIHFALNCGAKSCPPIAFYTDNEIDEQLEMATQAFLEAETKYDTISNKVFVSKLMLMYLGDFDGRKGIVRLLKKYNIIADEISPKVRFNQYDWTLALDNYMEFAR